MLRATEMLKEARGTPILVGRLPCVPMMHHFVVVLLSAVFALTCVDDPSPKDPLDIRWTETAANVRAGRGTQYPVVRTLPTGTRVSVDSLQNDWWYVYVGDRPAGYIHASLLTSTAPVPTHIRNATPFQVSRFPERYLGHEITFRNIWWYPSLAPVTDNSTNTEYFGVYPNVSQVGGIDFQGMGALGKTRGVVPGRIAEQLVLHGIGGYEMNYFGTITGRLIRAEAFGSEYFFVIHKIVHHGTEGTELRVFQ